MRSDFTADGSFRRNVTSEGSLSKQREWGMFAGHDGHNGHEPGLCLETALISWLTLSSLLNCQCPFENEASPFENPAFLRLSVACLLTWKTCHEECGQSHDVGAGGLYIGMSLRRGQTIV